MKIGVIQLILWTFGVRLALAVIATIALAVAPAVKDDLVMQAALLSGVNVGACALFAGRRAGRTWSETFALRRTSVGLVVLALALGFAVTFPAGQLAAFMERIVPFSDAEKAFYATLLKPRSLAHGVALFVFAVVIGPFSEELLFRGGLYTGLRPHHSAAYAALATGLLFTVSHEQLRFWPSILVLSGILGVVRAVSGSIWPTFFLHAAFNATEVAVQYSSGSLKEPSAWLVYGSVPVAAALLGAFVWVGRRSASADRARQVDLEPDPGLGAAES